MVQDGRSSPCQVNATLIFDSRGGYGTSILYIKPPRYSLQQEPTWYIIERGKRGYYRDNETTALEPEVVCILYTRGGDA